MFGIGPTELALFLVIVLLAVGPEKLPAFMRTVGKGLRQLRNASREFKEAIGLDELMREGDPFRAPPVRPPRARPVPISDDASTPAASEAVSIAPAPSPEATEAARAAASGTDEPDSTPDGAAVSKVEPS
ncbi:MAG: twin-arginine translocase TatA/TatE family subunit [Polyangiales bacterium]